MVGVNPGITERNQCVRQPEMLIDLIVINFDIKVPIKNSKTLISFFLHFLGIDHT